MTERVLLGVVTGVHGIRGQVKVRSFTSNPEDIVSYGALTNRQGTKLFRLSLHGATQQGLIASIEGIAGRNEAEAIKGTELYAERKNLPAVAEEEFYADLLIGMEVRNEAGTVLGHVTGLYNFGAGDILEIRLSSSQKKEMYPFTRTVFPTVSTSERYCIAHLPEVI